MKLQLAVSRVYVDPGKRRGAIDRAYRVFAKQRPEWVAALFDRHLLEHAAAKALEDPYGIEPIDLACAWSDQFGISPAGKQRSIRRAMPAATEFVRLLRAELAVSTARAPILVFRRLNRSQSLQ